MRTEQLHDGEEQIWIRHFILSLSSVITAEKTKNILDVDKILFIVVI